jgi:hydrogenase maturation protein HypF
MQPGPPNTEIRRLRVGGRVQGVGYRPFVYRLAHETGITGWVRNAVGDVEILAAGSPEVLDRFAAALVDRAPPLAVPRLESMARADAPLPEGFTILASTADEQPSIHVPPDFFACDDCLRELADPHDRRAGYPFINCTQCGPRYTLIRSLPYDRPNTSMAGFALCPQCRAEYENPLDRRFHAEPVACPACGPALSWNDARRHGRLSGPDALAACIDAIRNGQLVAVKGIGGYHLICDASQDRPIARLRRLKPRPHKPLAVMAGRGPDDPLAQVRMFAAPSGAECERLLSPERPIVLVHKRPDGTGLSPLIAPGLAEVGVMLPYSPLHQLLISGVGRPIVATSGNVSGEPVLTSAEPVEERLGHIVEGYLHHDRPIVRPADDSVYRGIAGRTRPIRLGRGAAPVEIALPFALEEPVAALGGHMKNTVCLAWDRRCVLSPHIGDMGAARSLDVFEAVLEDLQALYDVRAARLICDAHPGYATTRWADSRQLPVTRVFHHHAHASAAAFEADVDGPLLVFTWDGVGFGEDGRLWGGETFLGRPGAWRHVARMRPFVLPGGEAASRQPWRSAAALAWSEAHIWPCPEDVHGVVRQAWERRINSPETTAVGRLFDAAAALAGVCRVASFEGQGPMMLEALAGAPAEEPSLPIRQCDDGVLEWDWARLVALMHGQTDDLATRSGRFHDALAATVAEICRRIETPVAAVAFCGGVFQNRRLAERVLALLADEGVNPVLPVRLPVNDAAISFGQVIEYAHGRTAPDA